MALGYANTSSDLSRGGDLELNSGKASLYGTYYAGGWYLDAIVGGGYRLRLAEEGLDAEWGASTSTLILANKMIANGLLTKQAQ